jgi:IrrE N-terminal-like domain
MNVMRTTKPSFNRRALATQAMQAALSTRAKVKLDQVSPICIYGVCQSLGIQVRFNNINMEGMYQRGVSPRIHLSARRPLARRAYNCAHELGHHVFGHGSSIDELREDAKAQSMGGSEGVSGGCLRRLLCLRSHVRTRVMLSPQEVMRGSGAASLARCSVPRRQRRRAQARCFEETCLARRQRLSPARDRSASPAPILYATLRFCTLGHAFERYRPPSELPRLRLQFYDIVLQLRFGSAMLFDN